MVLGVQASFDAGAGAYRRLVRFFVRTRARHLHHDRCSRVGELRFQLPLRVSWVEPITVRPAAIAPSATPAHCGKFGAHSASTSPVPKPRSVSPAATRPILEASVPEVTT